MKAIVRVVSATVHNESNEVEIVIERTKTISKFKDKTTLHTVWINCERELIHLLGGE